MEEIEQKKQEPLVAVENAENLLLQKLKEKQDELSAKERLIEQKTKDFQALFNNVQMGGKSVMGVQKTPEQIKVEEEEAFAESIANAVGKSFRKR